MNRRSFFRRVAALVAVGPLARFAPQPRYRITRVLPLQLDAATIDLMAKLLSDRIDDICAMNAFYDLKFSAGMQWTDEERASRRDA